MEQVDEAVIGKLRYQSPIRSSRPIRSLARWPPRRVASLAMITMPVISPSAERSGAACARTNTLDPSIRWLAKVPSHGQPRSTFSAMCCTVAASDCSIPSDSSGRPARWADWSGKPKSVTAKAFAYNSMQFRSITTTPVDTWSSTSLAVSSGSGRSFGGLIAGSPELTAA
jgi:hypothetical protein